MAEKQSRLMSRRQFVRTALMTGGLIWLGGLQSPNANPAITANSTPANGQSEQPVTTALKPPTDSDKSDKIEQGQLDAELLQIMSTWKYTQEGKNIWDPVDRDQAVPEFGLGLMKRMVQDRKLPLDVVQRRLSDMTIVLADRQERRGHKVIALGPEIRQVAFLLAGQMGQWDRKSLTDGFAYDIYQSFVDYDTRLRLTACGNDPTGTSLLSEAQDFRAVQQEHLPNLWTNLAIEYDKWAESPAQKLVGTVLGNEIMPLDNLAHQLSSSTYPLLIPDGIKSYLTSRNSLNCS